jgi:hypothetical protein
MVRQQKQATMLAKYMKTLPLTVRSEVEVALMPKLEHVAHLLGLKDLVAR